MLTSRIIRQIIPSSLQVVRVAAMHNQNCYINRVRRIPLYNKVETHMYSQQVTTEDMTVDYEYTRNATANPKILIVDVREPDEIKEYGKIPNSVNIPLGTVESALGLAEKQFQETYKIPKPSDNTEIIFYCMVGGRSGKAQQQALGLGFKNAKNYMGSWTDWASKQTQ